MPIALPLSPEETRRAWDAYAEATRGLEGAEYDRAEAEAWQHLQDVLTGSSTASALHRPPLG
jgi:hypothetical protein